MATWTYRVLAILGCALTSVPLLAAEKTFDRSFDTTPGGQLTLDADVGAVSIVGRDSRQLRIHADIRGDSEFLAHLNLTAARDSAGVTVTERVTEHRWPNGFDVEPQNVHFTIEVPRDYRVEARTSGGSIDVRHLEASVRGKTSGGSIEVDDVRGPLDMQTSGGSIKAGQLDGSTELRTSGGSIEVTRCRGDLDVRTSGGDIRLEDVDGPIHAKTSGGNIRAHVRANRGISLVTSGGGIRLLMPASAHASIEAHTSAGSARSEIPLSSTELATRSELRGALNGGGEPIFLKTSAGEIRISAMN